jgi:hypothetical protein
MEWRGRGKKGERKGRRAMKLQAIVWINVVVVVVMGRRKKRQRLRYGDKRATGGYYIGQSDIYGINCKMQKVQMII